MIAAVFLPALALVPATSHGYGIPWKDWAQEHWVPFEERTLYKALGTDRRGLLTAVTDADPARGVKARAIADVARARGLSARNLERRLMRRWDGRVSTRHYRKLARRTRMILRDSHLGAHMLGHTFHHKSLNEALPGLLGLDSLNELNAQRQGGSSLADIAVENGRSVTSLRRGMLAVMRRQYRRGIRRRETPTRQLKLRMGYAKREVDGYLGWSRPAS